MTIRISIWALSIGILFVAGCASTVSKPEPQLPVDVASPAETKKQQEMVMVTASRLNLRLSGTTNSRIIGVLSKRDTVAVLGRANGWVNVQTGSGKQGWVAERYTSPTGPEHVAVSVHQSPAPAAVASASPAGLSPQVSEGSSKPQPALGEPHSKQDEPIERVQATSIKPAVAAASTGSFSREEAISLYNRHHNALAEGDLKTYFSYTLAPP